MKYVLCFLIAAVILIGCKKDEETTPHQQVSVSSPVTPAMYQTLRGTWKFKNSTNQNPVLSFINDSVVYYSIPATTDTFYYELKQHTAVNSIYMRSLPGHPAITFEQYFLIKENNSFWLVPDGEMVKNQ